MFEHKVNILMKKEEEIWHFNDSTKNNFFTYCTFSGPKVFPNDYETPYESSNLFDTVQIKDLIYFCGGGIQSCKECSEQYFRVLMSVFIKPDEEKQIEKLANMEVPRAFHAIIAVKSQFLYAVGGRNLTGELSSCEQYSIQDDIWKQVAHLNEKKKFISLCTFRDRYLYSFVGDKGEEQKESEIIEYLDTEDASAKQWNIVTLIEGKTLWGKIMLTSSIALNNDCILIFGGAVGKDDVKQTFLFYPSKKSMQKGAELKQADSFSGAKPYKRGDTIYMVGLSGDLHIYNVSHKAWDIIPKKQWNPSFGLQWKANSF